MSKILNIDFYPISSGMNPYIEIVREALESVMPCRIKEFVYSEKYYLKNKQSTDAVYMNWFENIQTDNILRTLVRALRRIEMLWLIKRCGIKVIVVIHNRMPHNSRNVELIRWFSKRIYKLADRIVILSNGTNEVIKEDLGDNYYKKIRSKITVLPHPSYYGVYPEKNINYRNVWKLSEKDFIYLFWGKIAPYKNVELFIDVAHKISEINSSAKFLIMGECSEKYRKEIVKRIDGNRNIILFPTRIDDSELTSVIRSANVVVMPLNKKTSLNSATLYLSLSCGVNVICPRIAAASDFEGVLYDYDYSNGDEHKEELEKKCRMAFDEYYGSNQIYDEKIRQIKNILESNHTKEIIGKKLADILTEVITI